MVILGLSLMLKVPNGKISESKPQSVEIVVDHSNKLMVLNTVKVAHNVVL